MFKVRSSTWFLVAFFAMIIFLFSIARVLSIVLFVATLLGILLHPLVDKLAKRLSRGLSAFTVLMGFIIIAGLLLSWIAANIVPGFTKLAHEIPGFIAHIKNLPNLLPIPSEMEGYVDEAFRDAANTAIGIAKHFAEATVKSLSSVIELIAIPVISFYFLKDGPKVIYYFTNYLKEAEASRVLEILNEIKNVLRSYMYGQSLISLISAITVFIYFMVVGLPYPLVFAAISAAAELAPVVGPTVASVLASILAYTYSPILAVKTLIFYIIMLKINHNLVYPSLIGKATKLHPVAIVSGVLFFGHIFGVLGMILAVPVLAVIRIIFEHYAGNVMKSKE